MDSMLWTFSKNRLLKTLVLKFMLDSSLDILFLCWYMNFYLFQECSPYFLKHDCKGCFEVFVLQFQQLVLGLSFCSIFSLFGKLVCFIFPVLCMLQDFWIVLWTFSTLPDETLGILRPKKNGDFFFHLFFNEKPMRLCSSLKFQSAFHGL